MTALEQLQVEILTEEDVAKVLGITVGTLRNRMCAGKNHPPYIPGTRPRKFLRSAFMAWCEGGQVHQLNKRKAS